MTRVRPVWDNLCKERGGCPFSHYKQNTAAYNYNQHLQSSINGLANTCCFFGTSTLQVKNITRLIKCHNPKEHFSFRKIYLPQLKVLFLYESQVFIFCSGTDVRVYIGGPVSDEQRYPRTTIPYTTLRSGSTTTKLLRFNCICYYLRYLFSKLLWILLSSTVSQQLETCF